MIADSQKGTYIGGFNRGDEIAVLVTSENRHKTAIKEMSSYPLTVAVVFRPSDIIPDNEKQSYMCISPNPAVMYFLIVLLSAVKQCTFQNAYEKYRYFPNSLLFNGRHDR